jgi:hypothetical protein
MRPHQLSPQPCMRQAKLVTDYVDGAACYFGRLFRGHAPEVTHFDKFGQRAPLPRQGVQSQVQIEELHRLDAVRGFELDGGIQLDAPLITPRRSSRPGMVHQDAAHRTGHNREEVRSVGELDFRMAEKLQVRLVHQGGGLQSVVRAFLAKLRFGNPMQGLVDDAHQFALRGCLAGAHPMQQLGDRRLWFSADGIDYTLR